MESKAKIFGHPAHVILIVFPLGLLSTAAIFDGLAAFKKNDEAKRKLSEYSFVLMALALSVV
jgi:uncharacterized membrane protein